MVGVRECPPAADGDEAGVAVFGENHGCTLPVASAQRLALPAAGRNRLGNGNRRSSEPHTFWGLCTRLISKLTAHTLCIYINRLLGKPDFLQIKALAFPN